MLDRRNLSTVVATAAATCVAAVLLMVDTWLVAAVSAVVLLLLVGTFVRHALAHRRLTRALLRHSSTATLAGVPVRLAALGRAAFVAGLARPTIFCDDALPDELSEPERRAVALHERAHQLSHDPLRMMALAAVAPIVRRFPGGPRWLETVAAHREIAADRYVMEQGVPVAAIASALTKVTPVGPSHVPAFSPAVDLRLRALLGDDVDARPARRRWSWIGLGVLVAGVVCLALLDHAFPGFASTSLCCG